MDNGEPQIRPQKYPFPWTDPETPLPASSLDPSDLRCRTGSGSDPPFFHNALDRQTDRPTHRSRESLTTIGRYAPRATRPKNGHGRRQLWTKYVVHIMLHKNITHIKRIHSENCRKCTDNRKHDKYSDNGKHKPNSSNNRPTREPGVTPAPAGGERLLLPVPRDSRNRQSRSRHSRGMNGGRSSRSRGTPAFSRGILPLPLPCKTLVWAPGNVVSSRNVVHNRERASS